MDPQTVSIKSSSENNNYKFSFDRIFDPTCTQQEVYDFAAKPIIESVLEGFNGTIFAYGQTSSGKTHTMQGILDNPEKEGIIPRMIRNVFNYILHSSSDIEYTVKVSMIEIYMEKIRDLIDPSRNNLNIREDKVKGIYIEDLTEHYVSNEDEVLELMRVGSDNRAIGATNMNEHSSRSHSCFIMNIHQNNIKDLVAKTGKLYLVDLAGSEKISKTGASGLTLEEAKTINKSLTTLGMVINNLTDSKSQHVPYRESKLTRVLQESLGGNSKTCLIITCSPSSYNEAESLSTLRFGLRAKKIKNKPKINKEVTVAELKIEIEKLERILLACNKRISQLESFIANNSLEPPAEGDYSFMNKKTDKNKKETLSTDKLEDRIETDISQIKSDNLLINESYNLESVQGYTDESIGLEIEERRKNNQFDLILTAEQEKKLSEITAKYTDVIAQVNILEDDKKDLNEKLEDAIDKIAKFSVTIEQKDRLVQELQEIKSKFEAKERELNEKISELEERLEIERNSIPVDGNKHEMEIAKNKQVVDEIYIKIQEIVTSNENSVITSDNNAMNNDLNTQLNTLFSMIRNKFKVATPENAFYNPLIEQKNADFVIITNTNNITNNHITNCLNCGGGSQGTLTEDLMKKEKKKFENEKKLILKALEEKAEKVIVCFLIILDQFFRK